MKNAILHFTPPSKSLLEKKKIQFQNRLYTQLHTRAGYSQIHLWVAQAGHRKVGSVSRERRRRAGGIKRRVERRKNAPYVRVSPGGVCVPAGAGRAQIRITNRRLPFYFRVANHRLSLCRSVHTRAAREHMLLTVRHARMPTGASAEGSYSARARAGGKNWKYKREKWARQGWMRRARNRNGGRLLFIVRKLTPRFQLWRRKYHVHDENTGDGNLRVRCLE